MDAVLIIGGGGFIGRHLAAELGRSRHVVYATHRSGSRVPAVAGVRWVPTDLTSPTASSAWPQRCDHVLFVAQARDWRRFPETAAEVFSVNLTGLMRAAEYARQAGARQLVFASTGSVYSETRQPAREQDAIDLFTPGSFYVASKLAGELLLRPYESMFRVVSLRLFMPYGAGQDSSMLLPTIVRNVGERRSIKLHNPDGLLANPVAIRDVVECFQRCLALDCSTTLNVAGPLELSLRSMATTIGAHLGISPVFEYRTGRSPVIVGDCTALRSALGWVPEIEFETGLRQWLKSEMIWPRAAG